jgi:hypothetical protein
MKHTLLSLRALARFGTCQKNIKGKLCDSLDPVRANLREGLLDAIDEINRLNIECDSLAKRNTSLVIELNCKSDCTPEKLKAMIVKSMYEGEG